MHIAAGTLGLILGPVAMLALNRPALHTRAGEAYHCVMLAVCITAALLAVMDWRRLWWFLPIAAGSYAFALLGYLAATRRWRGWPMAHIKGQGGSYIAMTTSSRSFKGKRPPPRIRRLGRKPQGVTLPLPGRPTPRWPAA